MKHTMSDLYQMQGMPLEAKVDMTKRRIQQWIDEYGEDRVYVSFSGGKDSTVLLNLVRQDHPTVKGVFVDTGLEYPEIRDFVKTFDNIDWLKPKMTFKQVIQKYGYPFISKEVSECVYVARKYLTSLIESGSLDRPTDRPTDRYRWYADCLDRVTGCGEYRKPSAERTFEGGRHPYHYETDRILGTLRGCSAKETGGRPQETHRTSWDGEETRKTSMLQIAKRRAESDPLSLNARVAMMTGVYTIGWGKSKKEGIPSKDRSAFSQEKYQFFLDAPFEISSSCCAVMKKGPVKKYAKETGRHPMTAQMASESRLRTQHWLKNGCNGFDMKKPISNPMAFWTEQDVLAYIYLNKIPICSVYGEVVKETEVPGQLDMEDIYGKELFDLGVPVLKTTGCRRTGCMFCGFGCHLEKGEGRFERMKRTHPKQYDYIMRPWEEGGLNYKEVIDWINEHGNLNIKY